MTPKILNNNLKITMASLIKLKILFARRAGKSGDDTVYLLAYKEVNASFSHLLSAIFFLLIHFNSHCSRLF